MSQDFQVRVHVIECREIKGVDRSGMSDPVVFVDCLGETQQTEIQEKTTSASFDRLMFFDYNMSPKKFMKGKISVKLFDANTIFRNVLIGSFEMDLKFVRNQPGHEIFRRWVAISDPSGERQGIQGFVRLSAVVLGPGEQAPGHTVEEEEDEDLSAGSLQSMVLVPPEIKTEKRLLKVRVYRAVDLPDMDAFSHGADAFVEVRYAGVVQRTPVVECTDPVWNCELQLPVTLPTMTDQIDISLWDRDSDSKNDLIAATRLSFEELPFGPQFVPLYGAPTTGTSEAENRMNEGTVEGSAYRGQLLLALENVEAPKEGSARPGAATCKAAEKGTSRQYTLRADILEAAECPHDDDLYVVISCGAEQWKTATAECKNGHAKWYIQMPAITMIRADDVNLVPDIFINLYEKETFGKDKRIAYYRIKASELFDANPKKDKAPFAHWLLMKPDNFNSDMKKEEIGGFLNVRLWFGAEKLAKIARAPLVRPSLMPYQLRAHIYQARNVPSSDESGLADPYCVVRLGPVSAKTSTKESTLFPQWYETLRLDCDVPQPLDTAYDINVMLYDKDGVTSDDYVGRFVVPVASLSSKMPKKPQWYPLFVGSDQNPDGEPYGAVLASFQLLDATKAAKKPIPMIKPSFRPCTLQVQLVGCRQLQSRLMLPVQKPFVEIDCGDGRRMQKTEAKASPNGTNPNYLQVMEIEVDLPDDPMYAPPINIRVFDDRTIHKPMLASRAIAMRPFLPWRDAKERREAAREEMDAKAMPTKVDKIEGGRKEDSVKAVQKALKKEKEMGELGAPTEEFIRARQEIVAGLAAVAGQKLPDVSVKTDKGIVDVRVGEGKDNNDALIQDAIEGSTLPDVKPVTLQGEAADGTVEASQEDYHVARPGDDRDTVPAELELSLDELPFGVYTLYRAHKLKSSHGRTRHVQVKVGELKARFTVFRNEKERKSAKKPNLKKMFSPTKWVVRAYILQGYQLVPQDGDGKSNPYLRIECGDMAKQTKVEAVKQNTLRPDFFEAYEFQATVPRDSRLSIEVWDKDTLSADDLIGRTVIDLENRVLSKQWRGMKQKPKEFRALWNPNSKCPQGQVEMWIDVLTRAEAAAQPIEDITPPARQDFEARLIVWKVKNVQFRDTERLMNDIFVSGLIRGHKAQTTDTHWRSEDGNGEFNWRMVWPLSLPYKNPLMKLQLWDKDMLNPNDAVCESVINLSGVARRAFATSQTQVLERQWIEMRHPNYGEKPQGKIQVSFELMTASDALAKPVGLGRDDPNQFPTLPPPVRPETSFNPFRLDKVFYHLVWKKYRPYVIGGCILCCLLILILIFVF